LDSTGRVERRHEYDVAFDATQVRKNCFCRIFHIWPLLTPFTADCKFYLLNLLALQVVVWVNSEQESAFQALLAGEMSVSADMQTGYD